ncbi:ImmA/IrrE family metallo-endopeptidase [Paenibacillus sp. TAB 01]|uniref:ImmA/IrrE family metallo-endopeptidase n=1 Tax=Paenibacillus sp. TAB 01 TaxID=3368988 RepID=UPI003752229B
MKKIPIIPRRMFAVQGARKFMRTFEISELPVDPFVYFKNNKWLLFKLSEAEQLYGQKDPLGLRIKNVDAVTTWNGKQYMTIYDDSKHKSPGRVRWTLAHEIGHIYLNHLKDFELTSINRGARLTQYQYQTLEKEADFFAKELLSPSYIVSRLGLDEWEDIASICKISNQAALNRLREFETVKYSHKIDSDGYRFYEQQFKGFLREVNFCSNIPFRLPQHLVSRDQIGVKYLDYKFMNISMDSKGRFKMCPRCAHSQFSAHASYCKMCGLFLYNDCQKQVKIENSVNCGEINPSDARYCEHCGSETYLSKMGLLKTWLDIEKERRRDEIHPGMRIGTARY